MAKNPDTVAWECPICGKRTRANLRTGLAFSHSIPGELRVCEKSGTPVVSPTVAGPAPLLETIDGREHVDPSRPRYYDGATSSVQAISTGLPGSNRRR